jgi:hypothetical protein
MSGAVGLTVVRTAKLHHACGACLGRLDGTVTDIGNSAIKERPGRVTHQVTRVPSGHDGLDLGRCRRALSTEIRRMPP